MLASKAIMNVAFLILQDVADHIVSVAGANVRWR